MRKNVMLLMFFMLSACGGGGSGGQQSPEPDDNGPDPEADMPLSYVTPADVAECSAEDIKMRVDFDMRDYYIYYDQVPLLNVSDYETPEELIRALRVDPDIYSYVTDLVTQSNLVNSGQTAGYGAAFAIADDGAYRFREIRGGSPAEDAGVLRGDEIITINGRAVEDYTTADFIAALAEENSPLSMTIRTGTDAPRTVTASYSEYVWRTAGPERRYTSSSNPDLPVVGYLPIRSFLETTKGEIDQALANLESRGGFDELVVDLRYNPGGRTSVARHIASIVGGEAVAGKVFLRRSWNDKYSEANSIDIFDTVDDPLNLPRVFVLATRRSSSASEVFINALEPYIDVIVIGGETGGKPFTSNAREYCDKSINAMRSIRTNAANVSVAGGIQPDCPVEDDWQERQSSVRDPLLSGALNYVSRETCPTIAADIITARTSTASGPESGYTEPEILVPEE